MIKKFKLETVKKNTIKKKKDGKENEKQNTGSKNVNKINHKNENKKSYRHHYCGESKFMRLWAGGWPCSDAMIET